MAGLGARSLTLSGSANNFPHGLSAASSEKCAVEITVHVESIEMYAKGNSSRLDDCWRIIVGMSASGESNAVLGNNGKFVPIVIGYKK